MAIAGVKIYYPNGVHPIHEVRDWCKVRRVIRAARRGEIIPPIVMEGYMLLTGTHRSAANDLMEMLYEARDMSPEPRLIDCVQYEDLDLPVEIRERIADALERNAYDDIDRLLKNVGY